MLAGWTPPQAAFHGRIICQLLERKRVILPPELAGIAALGGPDVRLLALVTDEQQRVVIRCEQQIPLLFGRVGHLLRLAQFRVHDPNVTAGDEGNFQAVVSERHLGGGGQSAAQLRLARFVTIVYDLDLPRLVVVARLQCIEVEQMTQHDHTAVAGNGGEQDRIVREVGQLLLPGPSSSRAARD